MKILKNIFDDKGIDVFVKYCVVFPNASAVCVNSDKVYTSLDRLKQDILLGSNKKISTNELIKILGVFGIQDDSLKCTAETVKKKPVKQKVEKTVHTQKEEVKPNKSKVQETVFASLEEDDLSRQISEQLERERNLRENEIRKACRNSKKKMHGNSKGHTKSSSYNYDDNNSLHRQMMNDDMLFDQQQLMNQQEMDRFMQESTHISEQACQESLDFTMHDSYNAMNDSSFNNDFGSFGGFGPFQKREIGNGKGFNYKSKKKG